MRWNRFVKTPCHLLPASHLTLSLIPASSGQDIGRPLEADLAEADGGGAGARRQGVEHPLRGQDQRRPRPAQGRPQGEKKKWTAKCYPVLIFVYLRDCRWRKIEVLFTEVWLPSDV